MLPVRLAWWLASIALALILRVDLISTLIYLVVFETYAFLFLFLVKSIFYGSFRPILLCVIIAKVSLMWLVLHQLFTQGFDLSFFIGLISFISFFIIWTAIKQKES